MGNMNTKEDFLYHGTYLLVGKKKVLLITSLTV